MKKKPITVNQILKLEKQLVVIIGKDEQLKRKIEKAAAYACPWWRVLVNTENNLHPYEQCRMIEIITENSRRGKFLLFTNSTYFVDHLVNLMKAAKSKKKEQIKDKFILKDKRSFISVKDVAVFDCEDGKIKNILKRTGDVNWDTFSKVSEWACDLYFHMED